MNRFRVLAAAATLLVAMTVTTPSASLFAAGLREDRDLPVMWQSAGDSYSSGEGVLGNQGACAQSRDAFGPVAADTFRAKWGEISNETFTACTGHLVEDYFNPRDPGSIAWVFEREQKSSLWGWSLEQGGPDRVDVVTMSFGGNDIGFPDVIAGCLSVPDSFVKLIGAGMACDTSEEELKKRVDQLLDPTEAAESCTSRRTEEDGFGCPLLLDGRRGSIIDFYYDVVSTRLTPRGQLYVVGYPRLFAPVDQWAGWRIVSCHGINRRDTEMLGRVADHFNAKLHEAVGRANQALGETRVHFADRAALFANGNHELCGSGDDWLNGIAVRRKTISVRYQSSFHPNGAGHRQVGVQLAQLVDETLPDFARMSDADLISMSGCGDRCAVTGRVPVDHPRWGPVEIVTIGPDDSTDPVCGTTLLFAVDRSGEAVWDGGVGEGGCPWYSLAPADDPIDADGRIFFNWNPGRYNGVSALTLTDDGFDDHGTLPSPDYGVRFYSADIIDTNNDGVYEIRGSLNPCSPSCAAGEISTTVYRWNGSDFVGVPEAEPTRCGSATVDSEFDSELGAVFAEYADNIMVQGLSCDDALLDRSQAGGREPLVYAITKARSHGDGAGQYEAVGWSCTVTVGSGGFEFYSEFFDCRRNGASLSFDRYEDVS